MPQRVLRGLHRAEDVLLAALLGALLLLGVAQIALRVFFDTGIEWAEPVSRGGVLWLALLGALGATRERKHIAMDALPLLLPETARPWLWGLSQLAAAVICGLLAWYGGGMVALEREAPSVFVAGIPSWWPMLAFPLGFALMALRFVAAAFAGPPEPGR
jgi:C4-dicarboxylate transporter, DctQ subunit